MAVIPKSSLAPPLGAATLLLSLLAGAAVAAPPQAVGITAAVVNSVQIKTTAAARFQPAALRQRVALADQVQTGARSRAQLLLLDKSSFTVGANARLTIDRFVYDPSGGSSLSASVAKGAFRFMSGGGKRKETSIKSPVATIGIRGTVLDTVVGDEAVAIARGERAIPADIQHDPQTATLVVLRGPGPLTVGSVRVGAASVTAAGETVELDRPLLAAYVPRPGTPPIGPFIISLPGLARLNDMIVAREEPNLPAGGSAYQSFPPRDDRPGGAPRLPPLGGFGDDRRPSPYGGIGPNVPSASNMPDIFGGEVPKRPNDRRERPQTAPAPSPTRGSPTPPASDTGSTTGQRLRLRESTAAPASASQPPAPDTNLQEPPARPRPRQTPPDTGTSSPPPEAGPANDYSTPPGKTDSVQ